MAQPGPTPSDRPAPPPPSVPGAAPARLDDDALVALFNQIRDELVSTLLYVIGNPDDAQDAAQEAFLKCWRTRHTMGDVQNVRAWIFRIGLNSAKDHQRSAWKRKSRPLPDDDLMNPTRDGPPGESLEDRETLGRLRDALARLRPEEREVFVLRQNGELTYEQIAELRGAPVGTVKTQMRAALQKLRKVLNPDPDSPDLPGGD
jgi:RNA polymerase sigma-70 factor (ECF subfamily)